MHIQLLRMKISDYILSTPEPTIGLENIHLSRENQEAIDRLLREYKHTALLEEYGLPVDNKVFLYGHTGCGKTTTAKAIAEKLGKKILILNLSNIISSRLGQTAKNISDIFQKAIREKAVLFIDEFDSVGKMREHEDKDSSEMKRLVNTIIQLIDSLPSDTLLIAATNHSAVIDSALLRRFQIHLKYEMPTASQLDAYYDALLEKFPEAFQNIVRKYNISYAEAKDIAFKAVKNQIIDAAEKQENTVAKA